MRQILARKTILEVQVPKNLDFYSQMDRAGQELLGEAYADWQRHPLWLEIQDRKAHRRIRMEVGRVFFESEVASEVDAEVKHATALMQKAFESLHVDSVRRIGLRQWFALEIEGRSERPLIEKVVERFSPKLQLEQAIGLPVDDIAYTIEFKDPDTAIQSRLILGAMPKAQWPIFVPYATQENMSITHLGATGRNEIQEALPDAFVLVDLDTFRSRASGEVIGTTQEALQGLTEIASERREVIRRLIRFIRDGQQT